MKLSEIRTWLDRACIVTWLDSGAWNEEEHVPPRDMELAQTSTSGILVHADSRKIVLEHEREPSGFDGQRHSVIATKMVLDIGNRKK